MMTDWHQRSIHARPLNGKAERTQEAYTRAVRMLSTFYSTPPEELTEPEREAYVRRRRNEDHWAPNTRRIGYGGIRFFCVHVRQRKWHLFASLRAKSGGRLPAILSQDEVRAIRRGVRTPQTHAFLRLWRGRRRGRGWSRWRDEASSAPPPGDEADLTEEGTGEVVPGEREAFSSLPEPPPALRDRMVHGR